MAGVADSIPRDQSPAWVPAMPQPTLGGGGSATVAYAAAVAAPPAVCVEVVCDVARYGEWNRWVPRATIQVPPPLRSPAPAPASPAEVPPALAHLLDTADTADTAEPGRPLLLLPGTEFVLEVHMDPDSPRCRPTELVVTRLEEMARRQDGRGGLRITWKTRNDPWYLRAERTQEFVDDGTGGTEYSSFETFYGPLAWVVKRAVGSSLLRGLALWRDGLKKQAEKKAAGSS
ncbi:hypothetical protein GGR56DRAFT_474564 [Xylariaceae sp. FL0804]|nr:hypothetical protein GGR56DRAFT_474564 [Xylariaceae sp. FL0804]